MRGAAGPNPLDRTWRAAYWAAHRLLRLWWRLRPSVAQGAGIAVWAGERLLVVRTSYHDLLDLPCGGCEPHESLEGAALRELREETDITAPVGELEPPLEVRFTQHHRQIVFWAFTWHPRTPPAPHIDHREIVWAGYLHPRELEGLALTGGLAGYLRQRGGGLEQEARKLSDVG